MLSGQIGGQYGVNRDGKAREYVGGGLVGGPLTDHSRFLLAAELRDKNGWDKSGSRPTMVTRRNRVLWPAGSPMTSPPPRP